MSPEFKSVWIEGTCRGDKTTFKRKVASCELFMRHVPATLRKINQSENEITTCPCDKTLRVKTSRNLSPQHAPSCEQRMKFFPATCPLVCADLKGHVTRCNIPCNSSRNADDSIELQVAEGVSHARNFCRNLQLHLSTKLLHFPFVQDVIYSVWSFHSRVCPFERFCNWIASWKKNTDVCARLSPGQRASYVLCLDQRPRHLANERERANQKSVSIKNCDRIATRAIFPPTWRQHCCGKSSRKCYPMWYGLSGTVSTLKCYCLMLSSPRGTRTRDFDPKAARRASSTITSWSCSICHWPKNHRWISRCLHHRLDFPHQKRVRASGDSVFRRWALWHFSATTQEKSGIQKAILQ